MKGIIMAIVNFFKALFSCNQPSLSPPPVQPAQPAQPVQPSATSSNKYAFLVGINKYMLPGNDLQGCVNDVNNMWNLLTTNYGFDPDNIRMICDERATQQAILDGLRWLVKDTAPGDELVFHYSGHGAQIRDTKGDELDDHMTEILCPHDLDWDNPLTDDMLAELFKQVAHGSFLTMVSDSCLAAETKIPLLDGTEKTISDMEKEGGRYWVYSSKEDGSVVPGMAHSARITGTRRLLKVTFDNGESLDCTEDHRIMMRDGTFKEAGKLVAGDSLMPLYRRVGDGKAKSYLDGYEMISTTEDGKRTWKPTHHVVRDYFGLKTDTQKSICHHKNFNKRDNCPDNLEMMSWHNHKLAHGEVGRKNFAKVWADEEFRAWRASDEYKQKQSELISKCWQDPEYREAHMKGAQNRDNSKNIARLTAFMKTEEGSKHASKVSKSNWENEEIRTRMLQGFKKFASSPKGIRKTRQANHVRWHEKRGLVKENCEFCCANNHKVVSVEDTGRVESVYDMTVDIHHNFAISAGVFVHNCHSATQDRGEIAPNNPHPSKAKRIIPPLDIMVRGMTNHALGKRSIGVRDKSAPRAGDVNYFEQRHMLISGCRDNQTSADAYVDGKYQGAMTASLMKAIAQNPDAPVLKVHESMLTWLKGSYSQVPNVSGPRDRIDVRKPFGKT